VIGALCVAAGVVSYLVGAALFRRWMRSENINH